MQRKLKIAQALLISFFRFVQNPRQPAYPEATTREKWVQVLGYFLIMDFLISMILWYGVPLGSALGWYHPVQDRVSLADRSLGEIVFSALIIAPWFEEGFFRYYLGKYRKGKYFPWFYFLISLIFGLIHILNYEIDATHLYFIPWIVSCQIFSGFLFGYIRVVYGFGFAVALHFGHNVLAVMWEMIF